MFYNFSGFLGYMVLAHYLTKYPLAWSWKKTLSITIPVSYTHLDVYKRQSISWGREAASSMALALPGSPMAFRCL